MADNATVRIDGMEDLKRVLAEIPQHLRKKVILGALRKAARIPLQAARQAVPVLSSIEAARNPYRTAGLLKKRLTVRSSKSARAAGDIGVFINIKPAAGAKFKTTRTRGFLGTRVTRTKVKDSQRGANSPTDPYYWRFVEFGTKKMAARPFIQPAAETLPQALTVFMNEVVPQIDKWNRRK